jgi:CBS domain-containing protein
MSKSISEIVGDRRETFSVSGSQTIRDAVDYMHAENVGAVAVCDGEKVLGVFSERDLLRRVVHEGLDIDTVSVSAVMSSPAYWISLEERYEVAKAIMVDKDVRHLVVMDNSHRFQGFVSSRELLEADLADSRELVGKLNDDYYEHQFQP